MTYTLEQYPREIRKQEIKINDLENDLQHEQQLLAYLDAENEKIIATAETLKNEQQRKAKRLQLRERQDYLDIKAKIVELSQEINREQIELGYLRNCFTVMKLNKREAIAQIMTGEIAA